VSATDARVTEEIRAPMGWLLNRTYRLAKLLTLPEVMDLAQQVVTHLDAYCAVEELNPNDLSVDVLRTRSLRYITLRLNDGARCPACDGTGLNDGHKCSGCEGRGTLERRLSR